MSEYLNIIGNWSSAAQSGRDRARQEIETQQKLLQTQMQNYMQEQKLEMNYTNRMTSIDSQAQYLVQNAIPRHKADMKNIVQDAENKLKNQLNYFGGDFTKFMQAGGRQAINEYRDSILNSDVAQIILANQGEVAKYLKDLDENPHLISDRDRQNFKKYMDGEMGSYVFAGSYTDKKKPSDKEFQLYGSVEEAYLAKNYFEYLQDYMIDMGMDDLDKDENDYQDELLYYVSGRMGEKEFTEWHQADQNARTMANHKSHSYQIKDAFANMGGYGTLNSQYKDHEQYFFNMEQNKQSIENLELGFEFKPTIDGATRQTQNKLVYGHSMLGTKKQEIVETLFGSKGSNWNGKLSFEEVMALQGSREATVYGEEGKVLIAGKEYDNDYGFYNLNDDWHVYDTQMMFKIDTGRTDRFGNPEYKLVTREQIEDNINNENWHNKRKIPTLCIVLRDDDGAITGKGYDDFRYVELNMDNDVLMSKLDKNLGESHFRAKTKGPRGGGQHQLYQWQEGKPFAYNVENTRNLVGTVDPGINKVFKSHNFNDEIDFKARAILLSTVMEDSMDINPSESLEYMASAEGKVKYKEHIRALEKGDYSGYIKLLREAGLTDDEIMSIQDNAELIYSSYMTYGTGQEEKK
tara:strand:- start:41035 stop:42933 length:1899 start_codon:yes stop_codon:yes gene_type:complete